MNYKYRNMSRLLFGLVAGAFAHGVVAADDVNNLLDEVVVSGSRAETKLSETPMSIGAVDEKAIRRDKPKLMGDVLNRISGVQWVDLGNEQHKMGIRQPNSTNAVYQYLEDGIPIRPLGVFNHNSLNELNLAEASRVEVVRGASSSLYGSNAVGGAINFITARPSLTPELSIGYRTEPVAGYQRVDTSASNTRDDIGVRFSHYTSDRSANNWQQYSNGHKDSMTMRVDKALESGAMVRTVVSYNNLDSATPGSLNPVDYQLNPGKSYQTFSWRKDKTTRMSVAWEGETTVNGTSTFTFFGRENDHGQLPNYTITTCTISASCTTGYHGTLNNNHVSSLGVDAKHQQEYDFLKSRLIGGIYYDASPNVYKSDNLDVTRDSTTLVYTGYTPSTTYTTGKRDYQTDIANTAIFAQWEITPLDKTRFVMGGRYDAINYNYKNNLTPGTAYGAPNEVRGFSHFSPKIGATYSVSDSTNVYANASQGFTPPDVSQLYSKNAIPDLRPATYYSYEAGTRMAFLDKSLRFDATVYRLDGTDTIVSITDTSGNTSNVNASGTQSTGIEMNLAYDAGQLDGRLAAAYARHQYVDYSTNIRNGALYVPVDYSGNIIPEAPNTLSAELGYKPMQDLRVALELVKVSAYWMDNANSVSYSGHTLVNLRGNYSMGNGWEFWMQGRNLTNQLYADSASSANNGVTAYVPATQDKYTVGAPQSLMLGVTYTYAAPRK